jgi:flagellin
MATIGTNIAAINATNYLTMNDEMLTKSIRKLASGSRLADPVDDAAGVAVSGNLVARIARLQAAVESSQNVISFAQTVDGFLSTLQSILTRQSELAQRATNGAFSNTDRQNYATEYELLGGQYTQIIANADFNDVRIFTGAGASLTVAINASGSTDIFGGNFASVTNGTLNGSRFSSVVQLASNGQMSVTVSAIAAITSLNSMLASITTTRAAVNADISKFSFFIQNIRAEKVNVQAANSRIYDLDVALESTNLSRNNILVQAGTAMLAQANSSQQSVLSLLQ